MGNKSYDEFTFKKLLKAEGFCPRNEDGPHRWTGYKWIDKYRVWFRECSLCEAVEIWRGNDTVYFGPTPEMPNAKIPIIFHHKNEFTENDEKALNLLRHILTEEL
ncbi:MAG: hypothetical protein QXX41_08930 [Nitrososphaerota archaeon]